MNHLKANILGLALLCCLPMGAQLKWNQAYQTYINQYKDLAIEQMLRYRIPASITLAQGLFESAAGRSDLVRQGNNHFGIKCHNWTGPTQYHDDDARGECFRVYQDARDSYEDHSKFLARQPRYARLFITFIIIMIYYSFKSFSSQANALAVCSTAHAWAGNFQPMP